jgi:hypothetical protein
MIPPASPDARSSQKDKKRLSVSEIIPVVEVEVLPEKSESEFNMKDDKQGQDDLENKGAVAEWGGLSEEAKQAAADRKRDSRIG